jgi:site-specific DNA recombinase
MSELVVAIYARVSSDQQAEAGTIDSQIGALHERLEQDGLSVADALAFVDEGYSGASLIRPGLERLRDVVAMQGIDRLYVCDPDRLARKYAYQALLMDEFQRAGVDVVLLNRAIGDSPEDDLLLQVQGMIAEYERAKILERSRRGKRHAARSGDVAVLAGAPYGYHYVTKQEGGGQARYEIALDEARVVRQVFAWIGQERLTIGEVCRRLQAASERTRTGRTTWDRMTILGILRNPAYKGQAAYGKTKTGPMRPKLRPQRGDPAIPKRPKSTRNTPTEEWIYIPVPALVSEALFEAVQQQLDENRQRARQRKRGASYLLQGLIVCAQCGYSYYGKPVSNKGAHGKPRRYAYYRCIGTDGYRFGGERVCNNHPVRTDTLDQTVWAEVCQLLADTGRLEQEYQRRLKAPAPGNDDLKTVESQLAKVRRSIARLIDSYTDGFIEKAEFEPRIQRLRQRIADLENKAHSLADEANRQAQMRSVITRLEEFAGKVKDGLAAADWNQKRDLIRTMVQRIEIGKEDVNVVFRIPPDPFESGPDGGILQHCRDCSLSRDREHGAGWTPTFAATTLPYPFRQASLSCAICGRFRHHRSKQGHLTEGSPAAG